MRKALCSGLLLATAACSQGGDDSAMSGGGDGNMTTFDVQEDAAAPAATNSRARNSPRPPGVAPTAAPGVAFNYRYAFRLPAANIGRVQEEHAQACEKLTVARCRITAMTYDDDGDGDIEAQLSFKLDPAIARDFGRDGIAAVDKAEGRAAPSRDHRHRCRKRDFRCPAGPGPAGRRGPADRAAAGPARPELQRAGRAPAAAGGAQVLASRRPRRTRPAGASSWRARPFPSNIGRARPAAGWSGRSPTRRTISPAPESPP